mmetsp:Transcript_30926/g.82972  ORF Transcript_30926/g.82972 Transcript_30926/m.82972 type:complete len:368 (-) Transcript_30926:1569-2672(-)
MTPRRTTAMDAPAPLDTPHGAVRVASPLNSHPRSMRQPAHVAAAPPSPVHAAAAAAGHAMLDEGGSAPKRQTPAAGSTAGRASTTSVWPVGTEPTSHTTRWPARKAMVVPLAAGSSSSGGCAQGSAGSLATRRNGTAAMVDGSPSTHAHTVPADARPTRTPTDTDRAPASAGPPATTAESTAGPSRSDAIGPARTVSRRPPPPPASCHSVMLTVVTSHGGTAALRTQRKTRSSPSPTDPSALGGRPASSWYPAPEHVAPAHVAAPFPKAVVLAGCGGRAPVGKPFPTPPPTCPTRTRSASTVPAAPPTVSSKFRPTGHKPEAAGLSPSPQSASLAATKKASERRPARPWTATCQSPPPLESPERKAS